MESVYDISLIAVGLLLLVTAAVVVRGIFSRQGGEISGWELSGTWRRVSAVARVTLAEGLRMRIVVLFLGLLLVTLPFLCLVAKGDGTLKGRVQMYLGYSLGLTSFYLSLLTIFFSARTLSAEIASHQIFGLASKPIPRWQILVGKWLGIATLNLLCVVLATGAAYAGARWIVHRFEGRLRDDLIQRGGLTEAQADASLDALHEVRGPGGTGHESPIVSAMANALGWSTDQVANMLLKLPEEVRMNLRRLDELRRQVLIARAGVRPQPPDLREEVQKQFERLASQGMLPESPAWPPERIREQIRLQLLGAYTAVAPGDVRQWVLSGPRPEAGDDFLVCVRYKIHASGYPPAMQLLDGTMLAEDTFLAQWTIGDPQKDRFFMYPTHPVAEALRTSHEFELPTKCVESDGTIRVALRNADPRRFDVVVSFDDGLEVLYRVASFEDNLFRAALTMMVPLMMLAVVGLLMSTFCTFPVAALVGLMLFAVAGSRSFLTESLAMTPELRPDYLTAREEFRTMATNAMFRVLSLGDVSPSGRVIDGRAILWTDLLRDAGRIVGLHGLAAMGLAIWIFRRRELAAVIV